MYIQPPDRNSGREPIILPRGYSGNAFAREDPRPRPMPPPVSRPAPAHVPIEEAQDPIHAPPEPPTDVLESSKETPPNSPTDLPTDAGVVEEARPTLSGGLLSRVPFLSSLLPPSTGKRRGQGALPEWLLIGAVILLLFTEEGDNDILPFLLLLLLWE